MKGRVDKDHTDRQIIPDETHAARQRMVRLRSRKVIREKFRNNIKITRHTKGENRKR